MRYLWTCGALVWLAALPIFTACSVHPPEFGKAVADILRPPAPRPVEFPAVADPLPGGDSPAESLTPAIQPPAAETKRAGLKKYLTPTLPYLSSAWLLGVLALSI